MIRWRTDEPPQKTERYLVTYTSGELAICYWTNASPFVGAVTDRWYWNTGIHCEVKAWMELPEPYDFRLDEIGYYLDEDESIPDKVFESIWEIIKGGD